MNCKWLHASDSGQMPGNRSRPSSLYHLPRKTAELGLSAQRYMRRHRICAFGTVIQADQRLSEGAWGDMKTYRASDGLAS